MHKKHTLATMFGIGLAPFAPGTAGSFVAVLLAYPVLLLPYGWVLLALGVVLITVLGTRSAARYMQHQATAHDPSEIVVDEWAGQWFTFTIWHLWLIGMAGGGNALPLLASIAAAPIYLGLGFLLFRFFDIVKPWPISFADRRVGGGFGVMFDDLLAGVAAGTFLFLAYLFAYPELAALGGNA